ncbi:MAG: T9SS type A sorting domain-containing protein [Bacteroidetes bacterium]|nr:T9SS type A sorting domain-containing protein [Bacteroidota bacterium]
MKKLFFSLLLMAPVCANAQITLEHTYPANETNILIYNLEGVGYRYMTYDNFYLLWSPKINLYDGTHTLWKTIDPKIPSGYAFRSAKFPSTMLFDSDTGVEVVVVCARISGSPAGPDEITQIVDENGSIIKSIPYAVDAYVQKFDASWKLLVLLQDATSSTSREWCEVYSLPGQFLGIRSPNGNNNNDPASSFLYPNPMDNTATLDYVLPKGSDKGTVQVFNANGTAVRTYTVNQNTGSLTIQRDGLPAGAYFITTSSNGVTSPPQKIAVN